MKTLRVFTLALCIAMAGALANTTVASAAQYGRTLTGELVHTSGNQFRIVGVGSGYTAPSGTPLSALDGKTVQVELSPDGRVTQITEVSVPINPVVHGWSTVRGQVAVTNPAARTFTFAGDTQIYTAPASIDITLYNGKFAEAKMDENGNVTELNLVPASPQAYNPYSPPVAGSYGAPVAATGCTYNGQIFSTGSAVCQSGTQYRCDGTNWASLGTTCQPLVAGDAPGLPPNAPRSCVVGDATVANGSSICRTGTTYRCDDGAWINMQAACR
jgi:hypothetical protein